MYELRENDKIKGWMSPIELLALYSLATEMESIVELGSYHGRSTYALASGCSGTVTAIDNFSMCTKEDLQNNVGHFKNIRIVHSDISQITESVDMVFIDADHSYEAVKKDIEAWKPLTRKLISGHDFDIESVSKAVRETIGEPDEVIGSIWLKWIL